jgi:conserved hypothetical protein
MSLRRLILETGQGVSTHGRDATAAALRAVEDAIRGSSLAAMASCGIPVEAMVVRVTVAVPRPEEVDVARVAAALPRGRAEAVAVEGGLEVEDGVGGWHLLAAAAVEAWLPDQRGRWRAG